MVIDSIIINKMEDDKMKMVDGKDERRLYGFLAWTWPIISPVGEYIKETEFFSKLILKHAKIKVKKLLHLGCGGGHHDYTFKRFFKITSVDISEEMLKIAKKLNPEVNHQYGDMRTMRMREYFDAVTILDSISYMKTIEDLQKAFSTAYYHLKPGGVFLTLAEKLTGQFKQNESIITTHSRGNTDVTFIENYYDPDTADTSYEATFVYLIRVNGRLEIYTDPHLCGIFKLETWIELLKKTGFEVIQRDFTSAIAEKKEIFPLFICIKPL